MKTLTILLASLLTFTVSAKQHTYFVDKYRAERGFFKIFNVPMVFDSDSITRIKPKDLKIGEIYRIDYIATSPGAYLTDYQRYLNKKRWVRLYDYLGLDETQEFEKHAYYQTGAENKEEAEKFFHGFLVYFRQPTSELHELAMGSTPAIMEAICNQKVTDRTTSVYIPESKFVDSVFVGNIDRKKKREMDRALMKGNMIVEWGYDSISYTGKYHNAFYILTRVSPGLAAAFSKLTDRSLFDMFRRNKITENTLIVTDITGSMYPYYQQILVWHAFKMSQGKKMKHVFFNDGDALRTEQKEIGKTGGIYFNPSNDILAVYKTMHTCMKAGSGGDIPENNFEAVIKGLKRFPKTDNVLMLCDNWAIPRDVKLVNEIEKPINFIMCGAELGVHPHYLELARLNGGKITTVENSIDSLKAVKEGEIITVGKKKYKRGRARFEWVR